MIEEKLSPLILEALDRAAPELGLTDLPTEVKLERPPQKDMGDFATNIALSLASRAGRTAREVAEAIVRYLPEADFISDVRVAGPGFINFRVVHLWLYEVLRRVVSEGEAYGRGERRGERIQVEYVSVNPTGPLHVGHGRNAAIGDALGSVLDCAGYDIEREYYLNDYGTQMDLFGQSIEARYLELHGRDASVPEGGYHGAYVKELAREITEEVGDSLVDASPEERRTKLLEEGYRLVLREVRATVERFGVRFDSWFSERTLHRAGAVDQAVAQLREAGHVYESEGAIYFRATTFGDEKDRVLIRSNGEPTYFASDCAYLIDKFNRGFDRLIYVWGADHHGTVRRLQGAIEALGYKPDTVEFLLIQLVGLKRGGEPVRLSKRTGDIVTLDELLDEVGTDAARYTLLTRSNDSPLEFDIEVVKRQSLDNPVYYVQYAHARIASIVRHAQDQGVRIRPIDEVELERLSAESELELLWHIAEWPEEVETAAALRAPYRLTRYAEDLAARFHRFYTECRVVTDDQELTQARLWLCTATKQTVANVLGLLGVSAPESMERIEGDEG